MSRNLHRIAIAAHMTALGVTELRRARTQQVVHTVELPPVYKLSSLSGLGATNMAAIIEQVRMLDESRILVVEDHEDGANISLVTPSCATLVMRGVMITETDVLEQKLAKVINEKQSKQSGVKMLVTSLTNQKVHDVNSLQQEKLRRRHHSGIATSRKAKK